MPQQSPSWGTRPKKAKPAADAALDQFVNGGKADLVRLNVEISRELRARMKAGLAREGLNIRELVVDLLEKRFPK